VQLRSGENSILPLGQPAKRHKNKVGALFAILLFKATATDRNPSQFGFVYDVYLSLAVALGPAWWHVGHCIVG
jgi:hypothetical protein